MSGVREAAGTRIGALVEVRAALAAGASASAALAAVRSGPLSEPAAAARIGRPLAEIAIDVDTGDAQADLLVRALAVTEAAGAGAVEGVDQAVQAAEGEAAVQRLLRVRTTQARLTAVLLSAMPAALWVVFAASNPAMLGFYRRPLGAACAVMAVLLGVGGQWWGRRIVGGVARAVAVADPLVPDPPRRDVVRALALGLPAFAVGAVGAGPALALPAGLAGVWIGLRGARAERLAREETRRWAEAVAGGGAAETVELVAIALAAGAPPVAAVATVAPVAPPAARDALHAAARRLRGGWSPAEAFAGTGLDALGAALDATTRWGAPAQDALRRLARELRGHRSAAAEEAAERTQVALVFPTTLLTLPAFVLAVVPPLVWTAFFG